MNRKTIDSIRATFKSRCIFIFIESYHIVKAQNEYDLSWEEEQFSAILIKGIEDCPLAQKWKIDVVPEYRLYAEEIIKGEKLPKSAAKIDMRFSGWTSRKKMLFFIEAKNLCENDWNKKNNIKVNASQQQHRYINTGIDHFLNQHYPDNGCLAGYVLEGIPDNIIKKINVILIKQGRDREFLRLTGPINHHTEIYNSIHVLPHENELILTHIFLKF